MVRGNKLTIHDPDGWGIMLTRGQLYIPGPDANSNNYVDLGTLSSPGDATRLSTLTIAIPTDIFNRRCLFDTSSAGGNSGFSFNSGYSNANSAFFYNGANFVTELGSSVFVVNTQHIYVTTYNKTANSAAVYVDGRLNASGSFDAANNVIYGANPYVLGGRFGTNLSTFKGYISLQVLFQPVLSAAEIAALSRNPWGELLDPNPKIFLFGVSVSAGNTVAVPVASITFAGQAPVVKQPHTVAVPAANITFAGVAPTVKQPHTVAVPSTNITFAGQAPAVVSGGGRILQIPTATVTFAGLAPTIKQPRAIPVPAANIAFAGQAPSVLQGTRVSVPAANITFVGVAPNILRGGANFIRVPSANISFSGQIPTVVVGGFIPPVVGGSVPSTIGGGSGGGGRRIQKQLDELDIFKDLEKKVKRGVKLDKAIEELKVPPKPAVAQPEVAPAAEPLQPVIARDTMAVAEDDLEMEIIMQAEENEVLRSALIAVATILTRA